MNERLVADTLRTVSADVHVGLPPVDEVVQAGERRARNRRIVGIGAAAAAVAVIAGTVSVVGGDGSNDSLPAGVVETENPLSVPWWADGVLHLDEVTVPVQGLKHLVEVGDGGVAYASEAGDVVLVDAHGNRTSIGESPYEALIAGSAEENWVAWVDPRDKAPQLVVYNVGDGRVIGRLDLPYRGPRWERLDAGSYPVSIDDGRVYYATQDGDHSWTPGQSPVRVTPAETDLIDVEAGTLVAHDYSTVGGWGETVNVIGPGGDRRTVRGEGARLSPDGSHLAATSWAMVDGWGQLRVTLLATLDGQDRIAPLSMPRDTAVQRISFSTTDRLWIVVGGREAPPPTGSHFGPRVGPLYTTWDIVACDVATLECETVQPDAATDAIPVLPH